MVRLMVDAPAAGSDESAVDAFLQGGESLRHAPGPYFGSYGGRWMPESLIAALDELEDTFEKAKADPEFTAQIAELNKNYSGRPSLLTEAKRFAEHAGGVRDLPQARGPQPHRLAQDQQRAGPGAPGQAHGQDPRHRRNRRRAARRGQRHRRRPDGPGMRRLHGRRGLPPAGPQRGPDGAPRRHRHPGDQRFPDPQGRHQRGAPRLGRQRGQHPLPAGHRRRGAPVPGHGPLLPRGHRRGGPRPDPGADRPPARRRLRLHRRRLQRDRHLPRLPGRPLGQDLRLRGRRRRRRNRPPRRHHHARQARRAARRPLLPHAGRRRPDHRIALHLGGPGLPRRRPGALLPRGHRTRQLRAHHGQRGHGRLPAALPHRGHHPRHRVRPRPGRRHQGRPAARRRSGPQARQPTRS